MEEARGQKVIGHSLDAAVTLDLPAEFRLTVQPTEEELRTIFISSEVSIVSDGGLDGAYESTRIPGLAIRVDRAPGKKCERCWIHDLSVGTDHDHRTVCARCVEALQAGESGI
jgi:isoleucyl-tRNA synthetase